MSVRDFAWMDDALCAQVGGEMFFPGKGERSDAAQRICANCPVQEPCYEFGLRMLPHDGNYYGVFGGANVDQLKKEHRRRTGGRRRTLVDKYDELGIADLDDAAQYLNVHPYGLYRALRRAGRDPQQHPSPPAAWAA